MFEIVCLLRQLKKHCNNENLKSEVLEIQKKYLYNIASDYSIQKKDIAWNMLIQTEDHVQSAKFLGII